MISDKLSININHALDALPNFAWPLRIFLMKAVIGEVGKGVRISRSAYFENPSHVKLGNDVFINRDFYCSVDKKLYIKDRVMIGSRCMIIGGDHEYSNPELCMRFPGVKGDNRNIIIEEDAWIGSGVMLLKKSMIGEGAIVGASSLVNSSVLPYSVYAGQPARFIKPRFETYEALLKHLEMMKRKYAFTSRYDESVFKSLYIQKN